MTRERQGGFSLIELMVAMTITLIVSGAIYGLLAGGQSAFRREPELTERQQNIRLAMDMMMRDTANAGVGLPPFAQVFTPGLDTDTGSPAGPSGLQSDAVEMLAGGGRESEPVCVSAAIPVATPPQLFLTRTEVPPIDPTPTDGSPRTVFLIYSADPETSSDDRWTTRRVTAQGPGTSYPGGGGTVPPDCLVGTDHATVTFAAGNGNPADLCLPSLVPPVGNNTLGCPGQQITRIAFANQVRYQIRADTDGVPVLQRSSTENAVGVVPTFETLARGIEELQIQYTTVADPDTWLDDAPVVADPNLPPLPANPTDYGTLINQVRITLTSRSEAQNLAGATTGAGGTPIRVRGSLTSTSAPRATLMHLARNRPPSPMPSPGTWYWE